MASDRPELPGSADGGAAKIRADDARILELARPHQNLLWLYLCVSATALVLAPIVFVPLYFKYHTLRYRLDEEGISASWGILFRREVHLTYKRIQDIHVKRNLLERWLGIATVQIQTASGSSSAELALEGMSDYEAVRDFLYRRMRGHEFAPNRGRGDASTAPVPAASSLETARQDELVQLLTEIRAELVATRAAIEARRS